MLQHSHKEQEDSLEFIIICLPQNTLNVNIASVSKNQTAIFFM